jgi:hypothetical protein
VPTVPAGSDEEMLKLLVGLAPGLEPFMFDGEEFPPPHPVSTAAVNNMPPKAAKPERELPWTQAFCPRSNTQENIDPPLEKNGVRGFKRIQAFRS